MYDKVYVVNEHTGEERWMGEAQFARVKKNGWSIIPETKKPKEETGQDSSDQGEGGQSEPSPIDEILKGTAKEVVAKIKELAEAGDYDTINAIGEQEAASKDPRSTIAVAVTKANEDK